MRKQIILLILIVLLVGCKVENELIEPLQIQDYKDVLPGADQFEIAIPEGWRDVQLLPNTYLYHPPSKNPESPPMESVSVKIIPSTEDELIEDLVNQEIEANKKEIVGLEIIEQSHEKNKASLKAKSVYQGMGIEMSQIFIKFSDRTFITTYLCPENSCNHYSEFEMIANSVNPLIK